MRLLISIILAFPFIAYAHGPYDKEPNIQRQEEVNQFYLDEIGHKASAPTRLEKTRDDYKDNPRNVGFAASFGGVYSKTPVMIKKDQ